MEEQIQEQTDDGYAPIQFEELPENLREACSRASWNALMPVQAHSLPYTLNKRDIMVQSRTGSGKTGAGRRTEFVLKR